MNSAHNAWQIETKELPNKNTEYRVVNKASVERTSRAVGALSAELIRGMIPKEQSTSRPKGSNMNERLLEQLGDHLIGLWRFRIYGVRRLWCVTLHVNGYYFDMRGKRLSVRR